jgi:ABC-2 type transport system permease protein
VVLFFSGMAIPIRFFPHVLRELCYALPFAAVIQTPVDVWLGKRHGAALAGMLALQLFWAVVLLAVGRLLLARATRRLVIQGG